MHLWHILLHLVSLLLAAAHAADPPNALTTTTGKTTLATVTTDTAATADPDYVPVKTPDTTKHYDFTFTTATAVPTLHKTTSVSPTIVWITTTSGAVTVVYSSGWVQTFTDMYSTVQSVPTGSIGLGTLKGTVGTQRRYITVSAIGKT
ncbi:uncharacterized protein C5L36_0B09980 [Pichia kudriavzevii]|uniref:Uncharacterized protein n=1 Tax=Pichia kudriavzevii TaxID=4909 RepID=A0A2U9R360_PICKU|nr:uncharacterized protein C5L36_0B09980 [Pichia kudriavzevii]AWU75760.1 hypothetical protein C5L36_0B09980 [Pichia kudriavzevii]